ncbi:paraquat-inducible protein A [Marinobacter sp. 1Y8]
MSHPSDIIICEYCDSVYQRPQLARHQRATCQRCGGIIARHRLLSVDQALALSVTAAMMMAVVCFYPVLFIRVQGQVHSATLLDTSLALAQGPVALMAVTVALATLMVPALQVTLMTWLFAFARKDQRAPGFRWQMRTLEALRPWSMLEVFLLGALVSVVKLSGRLDVFPAAGLFALAALSVLIIGLAGRDLPLLWNDAR